MSKNIRPKVLEGTGLTIGGLVAIMVISGPVVMILGLLGR